MKTKARTELRKAIAVHHTATDTGSWDGPKNEANLSNDDGANEYRKAYAWVDPDKDPDTKAAYRFIHHDVSSDGSVGAANKTACSATIAVLNGGRGGSTIPDADRQGVYDHVAAHLVDAGVEKDDLPELKGARPGGAVRQDEESYQPAPYHADADETVQCPECGRMNDPDAEFCDQCGVKLAGRHDVEVVEPEDEESEPGVGEEYNSGAPPRSNLLRARPMGALLRQEAASPSGHTMFGYFSEFNTWYEVDSLWEGNFMERVSPGAFADTITNDRAGMRVLFDHGMDWHLSFKPLGPIAVLEERDEGPYYEVPLYDTDYNRDFLIPVLRGQLMSGETVGSGLGASMRFVVQEDQWNRKPKASKTNPEALPERTITRAKVLEFGPVTFPANAGASAGLRGRSDLFLARLAGDPRFLAAFSERVGAKVARRILEGVPEDLREAMQPPQRAPDDPEREARLRLLRRRAQALLHTAA